MATTLEGNPTSSAGGASPLQLDGLEPQIAQLGVAIGLLQSGATEGTYVVNVQWFENPIASTQSAITANGQGLAGLFESVLGGLGGTALGVPVEDPGTLGSWYPILNPATKIATGLYLVAQPNATPATSTVFGLGVNYTWTLTETLSVRAWALVPLLSVGNGSFGSAFGGATPSALTIGVETVSTTPLIDAYGLELAGMRLSGALVPGGSATIALEAVGLQLPGESSPSDRSLADLEQLTGAQILSTVSTVFVAAMSQALSDTPSPALGYVLPVLGLSPVLPEAITALFPNVQMPVLRWDEIVDGATGGDLAKPFKDWFNALLGAPPTMMAWLCAIQGLEGLTVAAGRGDGSRANPWNIQILSDASIGTLFFTFATTTDNTGVRTVYPGLSFAGAKVSVGGDAAIRIAAVLELAQFTLSPSDASVAIGDVQFDLGIQLVGSGETGGVDTPLLNDSGYLIGQVDAGLRVSMASGTMSVVPSFTLSNLVVPQGNFASLDLLQPGQVISAAEAVLAGFVDSALQSLFGPASYPEGTAPYALAALLGVVVPGTGTNGAWPITPPLSSATQIISSLADPAGALAAYYFKVVSATFAGGEAAFPCLLQQLAILLNTVSGGSVPVVTGSGSAATPWQAPILGGTTVSASVQASVTSQTDGSQLLTLGLGLGVPLTLGSTAVNLGFDLGLLGLDLTATSVRAQVLPDISLSIQMPQPFTSGAVGGTQVQIGSSSLLAGWSPYNGWNWSASVGAPVLLTGGHSFPVGQDMVFSDGADLEKLILDQAATFGQVLLGVLGLAVMRADATAGLAISGLLGLLPDLGPLMPTGLSWPSGMPAISLTSFGQPFALLQGQLQALAATPANLQAALGLLAFASSGKVSTISGSGTPDDPFAVPFGLAAGIGLAVWTDSTTNTLGFGIDRSSSVVVAKNITATTRVTLRLTTMQLTGSGPATAQNVPGARILCTLASSAGQLLPPTPDGTSLDAVSVGVDLSVGGTIAAPQFTISPEFNLYNLVLQKGTPQPVVNLAAPGALTPALVQEAFQAALSAVLPDAVKTQSFGEAYDLLAAMGLAVPQTSGQPLGINPAGWNALLASPLGYTQTRLLELAEDLTNQAALFRLLQQATGITLPTVPTSVLELLSALGLVQDAQAGYVLIPSAFVQLFSHPVQFLQKQFSGLLNDADQLEALLTVLQQAASQQTNGGDISFGPFELQISSGPVVSLSIPQDKVSAGGLLQVFGALDLALNKGAESLSLTVNLFNSQVKFALQPILKVGLDGTANFTASLVWGDGTVPAPPPLAVWPFQASNFETALSTVAPYYALSVLVSEAIDPLLLQKYPLAQALFGLLGIAEKDVTGNWHTKSLLGLFQNPVDWFLSDAVIGKNGQLNIQQLQTLLADVPAASISGSVNLAPVKNGIALSGLPYGLQVSLTADPVAKQVALSPSLSQPIAIGGGVAKLNSLSFGLTLGPDFQPGFGGSIGLGMTTPPLGLAAGYDGAFNLAVTGENQTLQVVPFPGWQKLVTQGSPIVIQALVQELTSQLITSLNKAGATAFAAALTKAGSDLNVSALMTALAGAGADAGKLEQAALGWVAGLLKNPAQVSSALSALISPYITGITTSGGLVQYSGTTSVPVALSLGMNANNQLGVWVSLNLPKTGGVLVSVQQSGVSLPYDPSTNTIGSTPTVAFGLNIALPVMGEAQYPTLSLGYSNGFTASFDPMGGGSDPSDLAVMLLPSFFNNPPNLTNAIEAWLLNILEQAVPRYLALVVLNEDAVKGWLNKQILGSGAPGVTPGTALISAGLLVENSNSFALPSYSALSSLTVLEVLSGLAKTLLSQKITVLTFDGGKGQVNLGASSGNPKDFGISIVAQDISLSGASRFQFQLGAADVAWIAAAGGPATLSPGFGIFLPVDPLDFSKLRIELVNVGVDFTGEDGKPLVETDRFTLGAVQPRAVVVFDFSQGLSPVNWGAEMVLADVGISLAPQSLPPASSNPVAANLLGSGTSSGGGGTTGQAANPPFSIQAGYMNGGSLLLQLLQAGGPAQEIWFQVQRAFGPLHVNMLGVELNTTGDQTRAGVGFDGSVQLAGLEVDVQKLTVSLNLQAPADYSQYELDLAGLDISFQNGPVSLSGAFFKQTEPVLQYSGSALLKCASFSLNALGSYAVVQVDASLPACQKGGTGDCPTAASLFIFVNLNAVLGGPPAFVVTGLAAGFGYNRNINIPAVQNIATFPFVQGAVNPSTFAATKSNPLAVLTQISSYVPPQIGTYWLAAGVKFTSFELLNSFALLFVKFGSGFEMDLVGITSASLPPQSPQTLAYIELALLVSFKPNEGFISVQAQLTPNSYLLAPSCQLTGGFALVIWFSGDFVVTLGGYHPAYNVPKNYPSVPRLGFMWPVSVSAGSLSISGGAYFALTPTAFMAGGYLNVAFTLGPIRAWLNAGADFLIQWKPFYYDISIGISIGVAFHTTILGVSITLSVSLGASLHLWGPSTSGYAEIDWYVVSFSIPIGSQSNNSNTNFLGTWSDFATNFLPPTQNSSVSAADKTMLEAKSGVLAAPPTPPPPGAVLTLAGTAGVMSGDPGLCPDGNTPNAWMLTSSGWQVQVSTAIPATTINTNSTPIATGPAMGVRPMSASNVTTELDVTLNAWGTNGWTVLTLASTSVTAAAVVSDSPNALWAKTALNLDIPPSGATTLPSTLTALTLTAGDVTITDPIGPIDIETAFSFTPSAPRNFPAMPTWAVPAAYPQTTPLAQLMSTVMAAPVVQTRTAVLAAIRTQGFPAEREPSLTVLAAYADQIYQAPPVLAATGTLVSATPPTLSSSPAPVAPPLSLSGKHAVPQKVAAVELIGGANRYRSGNLAHTHTGAVQTAMLRLPSVRTTGRWIERTTSGAPHPSLQLLRGPGFPTPDVDGVPSSQQTVRVMAGSAALLHLSIPSGSKARMDLAGNVRTRILELNQYEEAIDDHIVNAGTRAALHDQTVELAVLGLPEDEESQQIVGWQRDSMLVQAGRYNFIGSGCTLRPQASPVWRDRGRSFRPGLVEAAAVLGKNRVSIANAEAPGWLETLLQAGPSSVAISVAAADAATLPESLEVRLAWGYIQNQELTPAYAGLAVPSFVQKVQGGAVLHFDLPAVPAGTEPRWLGVLIAGPLAAAVEGVWGVPGSAAAAVEDWKSLVAPSCGVALLHPGQQMEQAPAGMALISVDAADAESAPFGIVGEQAPPEIEVKR